MKFIFILLSCMLVSSGSMAGAPLNPEFTEIGGAFSTPLGVRNAGDGSNRLFVIERNGVIRVIDSGGNTLGTPFLSITPLVDTFFEGGLQGLAFHPDYENNGYFYVNYTSDGSGSNSLTTNIVRYTVSAANANVADASSALSILTVCQPAGNHNGGDLHFGADGYLYIAMGDGGASSGTSQTIEPGPGVSNCNALLGSVLRIDVDNPGTNVGDACAEGVNYGIPADNPFTGNGDGACDEIWAYGLRNPYRFSVDSETGDILIADVGAGSREEVNFQAAASAGGENYGWNCREGGIPGPGGCNPPGAIDPINEYAHTQGRCSITGGFRYRGPETTWYGTYLYGDFCTGEIFYTQFENGNWTPFQVLENRSGNVYGFGEAEDGRLFYTSGNRVYEINDMDFTMDDLIFMNGFE